MLRLMKKAGCNFIKIGIESGSDRILEKMKKGITVSEIVKAAELLTKIGIHWSGYFLIGIPGETKDDIYKTWDLINNKIKPNAVLLGVYEPFPGTLMFTEGIERGLVKSDMALKEFYTTLPNNYYKKDFERQVDTIDQKEFAFLEEKTKKIFSKYNNRFVNILKMIMAKKIVYIKEPNILFEDIRKYISYVFVK